jgi:hypothetical protein
MPNGGSDCCGTCWFNRKNKGEAGYSHTDDPEPNHCEIRDLAIDDPFYTYCANHPHRIEWKLRVPIGPVFTGDSFGNRQVWLTAPDNEDIRKGLLELLSKLPESGQDEYPIGRDLGSVVIDQLVELNEQRAISDLQRLAQMDEGKPDRFGNTNRSVIEQAKLALAELTPE